MLHGCGQDAKGFAASTRMNRVAARERFMVLYLEQDRLAGGAQSGPARNVQRGQRYPMTEADCKRKGRLVVTRVEVAGLGHAWSGRASKLPYGESRGPDASRLVWAFVKKQFRD